MSWKHPKSLEKLSGCTICITLVSNFAKVTKTFDENFSSTSANQTQLEYTLQIWLTKIEKWLHGIPGFRGSLGKRLLSSIDEATELNPNKVYNQIDHVTALALKIILLDSVFIDRDYMNIYGLCSIPLMYERLTCSIFKHRCLKLRKLSIYGAMFPSIIETIISNSPNLKFLEISQINLTDNLMECIAKCSNLEVLHLMHDYIWLAISSQALCRGFFKDSDEDYTSQCYKMAADIPRSFDKLSKVYIGNYSNKFMMSFYRWFLYFYDVESIGCSWKVFNSDDGWKYTTEKIILPLIRKEKKFNLDSIFLNADLLASVVDRELNMLIKHMPNVNKVYLDCELSSPTMNKSKRVSENFRKLTYDMKHISSACINLSSQTWQNALIAKQQIEPLGTSLTSLTITSEYKSQLIKFPSLLEILSLCPNMKTLKILLLTRFSLKSGTENDLENIIIPRASLTEFWLHEVSPWEIEQSQNRDRYTENWLILLKKILFYSPDLQILSLSICETMPELLQRISSDANSFHLHFKDGCEWKANKTDLVNLIKRFPYLENIYFEELDGEIFWEIKKYFCKTNLNICWGNLGGWPRT